MHMNAADKENHTIPTLNILCNAGVVVERSRGEDQATAGSLQSICWGSQVCTTSALRTLQPPAENILNYALDYLCLRWLVVQVCYQHMIFIVCPLFCIPLHSLLVVIQL
jgi:hypothetical protein